MTSLLSARNVSYRLRHQLLVDSANLELNSGEVTVVIGPNGAGKSTLLRLLSGETRPTGGNVVSLGEDLARLPAWKLACRRAVMAQSGRVAFPLRAHEVVRLGLDGVAPDTAPDAARSMIGEALDRAGVLHLAGRDILTLSGGEQQRVFFARTLCQLDAGRRFEARQALFLDEPIASLDLSHQIRLLETVRSLARTRAMAVVAVLHDINLALWFADQLAVMHKGRIVARGSPEAALDKELLRTVFGVRLREAAEAGRTMPMVVLPQFCAVDAEREAR